MICSIAYLIFILKGFGKQIIKEVKNQIDGAVRKIQQKAKKYNFFWAEDWIEIEYKRNWLVLKETESFQFKTIFGSVEVRF